jgi:hypothetical protein
MWRVRNAAFVLAIAGLIGLGVAGGWALRGWVPSGGVGVKTTVVQRPVTVQAARVASGTLPNVLGLEADEARQVYADAGVNAAQIAVVQKPYVTQEGTVVAQDPPAASAVPRSSAKMTLTVAGSATMPDLTGTNSDDARAQLADIGVGATTVVRYADGSTPGTVVRSRPAAGDPAQPHATLVVSEAPSSVNVSDLSLPSNDCSFSDAQIGGSVVPNALVCSLYGQPEKLQIPANDRVSSFEGSVVLADDAPAHAKATLTIKHGNTVLDAVEVSSRAQDVKIDWPGGDQITLVVSSSTAHRSPVSVAITDAHLTGARSGIDAVANGSTP